ncbi:MAG: endonuclease III domain-containing protein [Thermomicrobiales bacterium]
MTKPTSAQSHPVASDRAEQTRVVAAALRDEYGDRPWRRHLAPIDELVATILSQHTSDGNTERAFRSLKAGFPEWADVIAAPTAEVAGAIRTGGLANIKAPRIQNVLREVRARFGSFDLGALAESTVAHGRAQLTALHGVGPKTASCVLLFSLGLPAMPVDTHVHRVTRRLGVIGPKVDAEAAHPILESLIGENRDDVYALHMHLIRHGRTVCQARTPACDRCVLTEHCDYYAFLSPTGP